jgi:hypothetical protein
MLSPFVAQLAERGRVDSESADDNSADFRIGGTNAVNDCDFILSLSITLGRGRMVATA